MPNKALIVDANILVRAVLGKRARKVIETYAESVSFFVPEAAYAEAEEHLAALVIQRMWRRNLDIQTRRNVSAGVNVSRGSMVCCVPRSPLQRLAASPRPVCAVEPRASDRRHNGR
jgi:hypothetical protein